MSDTLLLIILLVPALVIAIVFHEVAHGLVAKWLGDPTASERKRLSLNPIRHVDPVGTLLVPGFLAVVSGPIFGWAKPVPVVKQRLNNPRFGMMAVAAAGPATNFLLAVVGAIGLGLVISSGAYMGASETGMPIMVGADGATHYIGSMFVFFILINVFLGMFNLLPIPPFDGSHIVEGAMPRRWVHHYERLRPFGMLLFIGLIAVTWFAPEWGVLQKTIGPPVEWALDKYLGLASAIAGA